MAHRPDREIPGAHLPFPPMPPAWCEPTAEPVSGPRPPQVRPPVPMTPPPPVPMTAPLVPKTYLVPGPATHLTPAPGARPRSYPPVAPAVRPLSSRPLSPIAYPGLPASAPPDPTGFGARTTDPVTGEPLSTRSSLVAGLLQIFLGAFGVGRFYTGHVAIALGQIAVAWGVLLVAVCAGFALVVPWLFAWVGFLWPFVDGLVLLAGGQRDSDGYRLRP